MDFLSFTQSGTNTSPSVTLSVHSTGATGPLDQNIVLQGVTMQSLGGASNADSAGVIASLLANHKLLTD